MGISDGEALQRFNRFRNRLSMNIDQHDSLKRKYRLQQKAFRFMERAGHDPTIYEGCPKELLESAQKAHMESATKFSELRSPYAKKDTGLTGGGFTESRLCKGWTESS